MFQEELEKLNVPKKSSTEKLIMDISETSFSSTLIFFVNGKKITYENPDPEWTLLYFLRYKLGFCGTKEGCGEGGCGACTLLLSKLEADGKSISNSAINACLMPLCSLHGCAIVTVEGIGSVRSSVHPIQERIAKSHGTQCGFCTPGFVMSMYALLRNNSNPTQENVEDAFQGNLCRCTGYRPILSGFKTFCCKQRQSVGVNGESVSCCMDKNVKVNSSSVGHIQVAETLYDASEFKPYDESQDVVFPPELQLTSSSYDNENLVFRNENVSFYRLTSWTDLLRLKAKYPLAKLLAGNTELGLEAKFKGQVASVYIQPSNTISELTQIIEEENVVVVGGGVTLANLHKYSKTHDTKSKRGGTIFSALADMIHWFAGPQIRNVATVAGNIITASPISDLNPIFMAAECMATLESIDGSRTVKLDSEFFKGYRQTVVDRTEILRALKLPKTRQNEFIWSAKQCRRREDDIAIVNTAMKITFDGNYIQSAALVFGGMAPTVSLAERASKYLIGKQWSEEILEDVSRLLVQDFPLTIDVPGGMAIYRQSLCTSFFYKFYLHVTHWLTQKGISKVPLVADTALSATRPCVRPDTKESQLYQIVPQTQPSVDLVGRPVLHLSALKHATGEAVYVDDIPLQRNELFGAIVFNRVVPYGRIVTIDPTLALAFPGVVDFFDSNSVPKGGHNKFGDMKCDELIFASGEVKAIGQLLGLVVAKDQYTAEKAAKLVRVEVEPLSPTILTIEDAIAHESYLVHRRIRSGNVDVAFQESDHVIEGEMRVGGQEHFYLETQSCVAVPKEDDEMEVFLSTQGPVNMQRDISAALGVPQNRITVKTRRIGGSFGGKETRSTLLGIPAALAAQKLRVPIRIVLNRYDDMEVTGHRNPYLFCYKVGFGSDGRIHGIKMKIYANAGMAHDLCSAILEVTILSIDGTFRIPNWEIDGWACQTNLATNTAFRGFGNPEGSVVLHTIFELVAAKVGKDSLQIRQLHLYKEGDLTPSNQTLTNCTAERCWTECLQNSDYHTRQEAVEEFNKVNLWKKRGIAVTTTKHNLGFGLKFMCQAGALVMIHLDGSVTLNHGGMEMGQGLHTKMIQIATRILQIPDSKIYFSETATDKVPNSSPTCGSFSSDLNGMAVANACETLTDRLKPFKDANPNGAWEEWVSAAYLNQTNLSAVGFYKNSDPDYDFATNSGRHASYTSYGAACSEVEIDCLTGDHTVIRTDIVMDVGESLNPAIDIGQIEGAFIQGYGLFLMEELLYSPKGHLLTRGPSMYKIPTMNDIPREFHVAILRGSSNPRAVYSSKGIGEPPMTLSNSVFFAIRNAISAARKERKLAVDFRFDSPATAERIRLACENEFSVKPSTVMNGIKTQSPWAIIV